MSVICNKYCGELVEQGAQRVELSSLVKMLLDYLELYDELVLIHEHETLSRDQL